MSSPPHTVPGESNTTPEGGKSQQNSSSSGGGTVNVGKFQQEFRGSAGSDVIAPQVQRPGSSNSVCSAAPEVSRGESSGAGTSGYQIFSSSSSFGTTSSSSGVTQQRQQQRQQQHLAVINAPFVVSSENALHGVANNSQSNAAAVPAAGASNQQQQSVVSSNAFSQQQNVSSSAAAAASASASSSSSSSSSSVAGASRPQQRPSLPLSPAAVVGQRTTLQQQQEQQRSPIAIGPSTKDLPVGYVVGALLRDIAARHVVVNNFHSNLPASHVLRSLTAFESSVAPPLDIAEYFYRLQHHLQVEDGVCIAVLLLLRRYAKNARRPISVYSVHRLAVTALLVASKLYSDFFFCCQAVALVGGLPTKELARMEIHFLLAIGWNGGITQRFETGQELVRAKAAHMRESPALNMRAAMPPEATGFSRLFPDSLIKSDVLRAETAAAPVAGAAGAARAAAAMAAVAANNPASDMTPESIAEVIAGREKQIAEDRSEIQ